MKKFLIKLFYLSSCTKHQFRSDECYEAVIGHIVKTIISGDCNLNVLIQS